MPYVILNDFKKGLEIRKPWELLPPDSCAVLSDLHISRGGQIEQRLSFPEHATALPLSDTANESVGLLTDNEALFVFSSEYSPNVITPSPYPYNLIWARCIHPYNNFTDGVDSASNFQITHVNDWTLWEGKLFVSVHFTYDWSGDAVVHHTDWMFLCDKGFTENGDITCAAVDWTDTAGGRLTPGAITPALLSGLGRLPIAVTTFKNRIIGLSGTMMWSSELGKPLNWDFAYAATPASAAPQFVDTSYAAPYAEEHTAIAPYGIDQLAVFSRETVQLWNIDTDWVNNSLAQTISESGAVDAYAVVPVGGQDVYFVDRSGVRSLRSREVNDLVQMADVGSPVDGLVNPEVETAISEAEAYNHHPAHMVIEPIDGRIWSFINNQIFVFSYFSDTDVAAWSSYQPRFTDDTLSVSDPAGKCYGMCRLDRRIFARSSENKLALYGGTDGLSYDATVGVGSSCKPNFWPAAVNASKPSTSKQWYRVEVLGGVDQSWAVFYSSALHDKLGAYQNNRVPCNVQDQGFQSLSLQGTHLFTRFANPNYAAGGGGPLTIHSIVFHFSGEEPS